MEASSCVFFLLYALLFLINIRTLFYSLYFLKLQTHSYTFAIKQITLHSLLFFVFFERSTHFFRALILARSNILVVAWKLHVAITQKSTSTIRWDIRIQCDIIQNPTFALFFKISRRIIDSHFRCLLRVFAALWRNCINSIWRFRLRHQLSIIFNINFHFHRWWLCKTEAKLQRCLGTNTVSANGPRGSGSDQLGQCQRQPFRTEQQRCVQFDWGVWRYIWANRQKKSLIPHIFIIFLYIYLLKIKK